MDTEMSGDTLAASDSPQPEETVVENEAVATPEEPAQPENPPAAEGGADQQAVNGHDAQVADLMDTEELPGETAVPVPEEAAPQPPKPEDSSEKLPEPIKVLPAEVENAARQPVPENEAKPAAAAEAAPEPEPEKPVEEAAAATAEEEAAQAEAAKEPGAEGAVAADPKVEEEKPAEAEAAASEKLPEAAAEVKIEPADAEPPQEEDSGPAPGSLCFALLEHQQTKEALRGSRTMVILRGLPGSGKSFLASAIADAYGDHCSVFCGDAYGVEPERVQPSGGGEFTALDEALVARCKEAAPALVVVDDTNHFHSRLARLAEMAEQHHLLTIFLEPQTEWSGDPARLSKKTKRGLEVAALEAMRAPLLEAALPLFFGWFLLSPAQDKVNCTALDFLKTLDTLEAFRKHLADFAGKAEEVVDLEHYFKAKGALHCTTKFCNYGKAEGAKEYAQSPAVKESYSSVSELSLSALFVTPRTVGARVALAEEQLPLWPADAETQAESAVPGAASLPLGSRAHVTLGCAEGVEPVQTGLDLLDILVLQQGGQQGEPVEEMGLGTLTYHGAGRWMLSLREPIVAPACFSSYYGRKETEAAKPEKKKKPKCTIL